MRYLSLGEIVDLHQAVDLVERGCAPELAFAILI